MASHYSPRNWQNRQFNCFGSSRSFICEVGTQWGDLLLWRQQRVGHCCAVRSFMILCFSCVQRRRPRGSTMKQQLHTKTHHPCQNVHTLGGNTSSTDVRRNLLLPFTKKNTCTERTFDNIPTCLHHRVMPVLSKLRSQLM